MEDASFFNKFIELTAAPLTSSMLNKLTNLILLVYTLWVSLKPATISKLCQGCTQKINITKFPWIKKGNNLPYMIWTQADMTTEVHRKWWINLNCMNVLLFYFTEEKWMNAEITSKCLLLAFDSYITSLVLWICRRGQTASRLLHI